MPRTIKKDSILVCTECKKEDYAIVWDELTKQECYTRELRRAFVSVIGTKGIRAGTKYNYKCPHCGRFILGSKINVKNADVTVE